MTMTTKEAVESALKKIGEVLTEFAASVDASAREEARQEFRDSFARHFDAPPHVNGVKPPKTKKTTTKALRPAKTSKKKAPTTGNRRSPEEMSSQAAGLFAHINSHPGQRAEEIAKAVGVDTKELPGPIRLLLKEKKIRASGVARGTTYTAI